MIMKSVQGIYLDKLIGFPSFEAYFESNHTRLQSQDRKPKAKDYEFQSNYSDTIYGWFLRGRKISEDHIMQPEYSVQQEDYAISYPDEKKPWLMTHKIKTFNSHTLIRDNAEVMYRHEITTPILTDEEFILWLRSNIKYFYAIGIVWATKPTWQKYGYKEIKSEFVTIAGDEYYPKCAVCDREAIRIDWERNVAYQQDRERKEKQERELNRVKKILPCKRCRGYEPARLTCCECKGIGFTMQ